MKKLCLGILLALSAVVSINAVAQTATTAPATPGTGNLQAGMMHHGIIFGAGNTPGWSMMSLAEHKAHHDKMHSIKTYRECVAYRDEHMKNMETRAKEKGKTLKYAAVNPCGMQFGASNTLGWSMMSRAERNAHRDKMQSITTPDECTAHHNEHTKQMEARAKEKGKVLKTVMMKPCEMMKDQGMVK